MKNFFCFSSLLVLIVLCSCNNDWVNEEGKITVSPNKLSLGEAQKLVQDFANGKSQTKNSGNLEFIGYKKHVYEANTTGLMTKSEDEVKEIEDEITVYELLMQKGGEKGFALVVGDKRIPDVLAYSEYGSLDDTLSNLALKYYFRTIPEYVSKRLEGCLKNSKDVCQTKAEDPTKDSYMHVCNLIVEWGQNSPYNNKTPYTCSTLDASYGGRAPAGCGPVAIAQLISFYRFPASYNWDLLLSTPTVSINDSEVKKNEISTLMYNLGQDMSTWYDCDGSYTAVNSMVATLRNYGYTVSEGPFGVLGIDAEMRQDRPILMTGVCDEGGHAWLITGYKYNVLLHPTGQYVKTYYCNMNWGWNGSSNGFYLVCTAPLNQSGGEMNPILPF